MAILESLLSSLTGFLRRAFASSRGCVAPRLDPEECLLEEAEVVEPIAPGMKGRVRVSAGGATVEADARGELADQAFARGMRVRLLDYRDGAYLVEPWDEEHLVR